MFDDVDSNRPTSRTRALGNILVGAILAFFWLLVLMAVLRACA